MHPGKTVSWLSDSRITCVSVEELDPYKRLVQKADSEWDGNLIKKPAPLPRVPHGWQSVLQQCVLGNPFPISPVDINSLSFMRYFLTDSYGLSVHFFKVHQK